MTGTREMTTVLTIHRFRDCKKRSCKAHDRRPPHFKCVKDVVYLGK
ncbi:MAG: hypothetical protein ABOK23_11710 [Candidatus Methanoperedens sp.]|nr:hypothetical protein [Candidatus Methanoperedens sp.]MCZ7395211.1 hypothetical protein [Candidatus Methanoperedens sp.]